MSLRDFEQLSEVESHLQRLVHDLGRTVQLLPLLLPVVRVLPPDLGRPQGARFLDLLLFLPGVANDPLSHLRVDLVDLRHLIVQREQEEEGLGHIWLALEICLQEGLQVGQSLALFFDPGQDLLLDHLGILLLCGPALGVALEGGLQNTANFGPFRGGVAIFGSWCFFGAEGFFGLDAL